MKRTYNDSPIFTTLLMTILFGVLIASRAANGADPTVTIDVSAGTIAIVPNTALTNADGESLTSAPSLSFTVTGAGVGSVTPVANNVLQNAVTLPADVPIKLTKEGRNVISVKYSLADGSKTFSSNSIIVELDTIGPRIQHAEVVELPSTGTTLLVTFAEDDFQTTPISTDAFDIGRKDVDGKFDTDTFTPRSVSVQGRTLRLPFSVLPAGDYQLIVKGDGTLTDKAGNWSGGSREQGIDQKWLFSVVPGRQFGQHVEFTPYAPPQKQVIPEEGFNPGDYVETRVARLFYFRDAHRVAQIINRNIRSYNQAAVTLAERRAEASRDSAHQATDERREKERAAVRAAEQARNAEQQLAQAQRTLAEAQNLERDIAGDQAQLDRLTEQPEPETDAEKEVLAKRKRELQLRIEARQAESNYLGSAEDLAVKVNEMQQSVANLRQAELTAKDARDDAEAREARAVATQFRDEVTAAETDPDTFVAGDIHSVDPVTQVSISVIGEGLIQLRGPIKGINKIRTMINQIDSPVGQIKIGIFSVQINGEKGDEMEKVAGDAEGFIDLSRFLVNQSLNLLRRAVQTEAAIIAESCELDGHYQVDRDRRYLYAFFGRDFIDELYEMNSEFMFSENKLLSLHSMDTVSFNRAMFILALAKNDVRERIVTRFLESAKTELPDSEFDFRRASELKPHRTQKLFPPWNRTHLPISNHYHKEEVIHEAVHRNALQRYHFRNFAGFFDTGFVNPDTMNPMQREFIRLAQIFKARLVAEMELKQRILERGLIEDRSNDENKKSEIMREVHDKALDLTRDAYLALLETNKNLQAASDASERVLSDLRTIEAQYAALDAATTQIVDIMNTRGGDTAKARKYGVPVADRVALIVNKMLEADWLTDASKSAIKKTLEENLSKSSAAEAQSELKRLFATDDGVWQVVAALPNIRNTLNRELSPVKQRWTAVYNSLETFKMAVNDRSNPPSPQPSVFNSFDLLLKNLDNVAPSSSERNVRDNVTETYIAYQSVQGAEYSIENANDLVKRTRVDLDHRKLLNHLIDEQEEKFIELVEGTRSHIAVLDQYLKRLSIALEDDFKIQFYDPAFVRVREAARGEPVNLSQVERTTILTNNRDFAKVDPQATMEFDLPKRQIAIKEAFDAAKALVEDTGALVNDPTFLSAFQMMGGAKQPTTVKNVVPGQSMSTDQQTMGLVPPPPGESSPGSALQSLVPEPAIYKLETGTGFQIRPVMQPDGDSAVYDFDYMYTTNIREPVRADEKHVGRIKRHFVHTAVQTGNFELREISRYQVALKVSRTGQGVPLLQDIPVMGALFRPAPSAESSLQQNIIFGQTNIYPTLFDLMGLRWAQQVVDLDHTSLLETEHVIRGRQKSMRDYVFRVASERVDEFLDVQGKAPGSFRPDFYHEQTLSSPHHPRGYSLPNPAIDPTGNNYERFDRRPPEMQEPPYDRYRHQPVHPERISPQVISPQADPMGSPYGQSNANLKRLPQADLGQFESLLLRGPTEAESSGQSQFTEGDSKPQALPKRVVPILGRDSSQGAMLESPRPSGRLQASPTMPQLRPRPASTLRNPMSRSTSAVVPASFEQSTDAPRRLKIHRLPPVR